MGKEIVTRLNCKTVDFESVGHGHGGLTTADIAASMTKIVGLDKVVDNKLGLALLLESVGGNREVQQREFYALYREIAGIAVEGKWRIKKGAEQLRTLLQMAILEHIKGQTCPTCKGVRYQAKDPTKPCRRCKGSGKHNLFLEVKSKAIGVSKDTWLKVWERRYYEVQYHLQNKEYLAMKNIYKKLLD